MWQPIETAPKDKRILLWLPGRFIVHARWIDVGWYAVWNNEEVEPLAWMPAPDAPESK